MGRKAKVQVLLAALIAGPVSAQTYDPTLIAPQIIGTPQTMTALNLGDDATRSVNLGFTFDYFGKSYTSAWVSSNGFVSFQGPANLCCDGQPMQNAQRNTIYAYWEDLISGPNPYYKSIDGGILFGWYGTNEYYNQNSNTFEIALYANGDIQINYGNVANSYHHVAAGLTGPTSSDNLQLFYGIDVRSLSNQSGLLTLSQPKTAEPLAPIAVTPTPTPTVAPSPVQTAVSSPVVQTQQVQTTAVETQTATETTTSTSTATTQLVADTTPTTQTVATTTEVAAATTTTTEQTTQETTQAAATQTQTQQTQTTQETKEEQKEAALPPGGIPGVPSSSGTLSTQSVKATSSETSSQSTTEIKKERVKEAANVELATATDDSKRDTVIQVNSQDVATLSQLDAQYTQQHGEQRTSETVDITYSLDPQSGTTFGQVASVSGQSNPTPIISFSTTTDASSGQAQQLMLLNMSDMQNQMSSGSQTDVGDMNTEDNETMVQLAAAPEGYSAYTQARIPDIKFYKPKDIYENHRIPDQNMALYLIMRGQDRRWREMVDEQYE